MEIFTTLIDLEVGKQYPSEMMKLGILYTSKHGFSTDIWSQLLEPNKNKKQDTS